MTDSKDPLALGAMHLANRLSIATAGPDKGVPFPEAQGFEPDPSACGAARPSEVFDYLEAAAGRLPAFQWPLPLWPDDVAHLDNDHNRKYAPHLLVADDPIRLRIVMERAVVRAAAAQLIADGWLVRVYYGDSQHGEAGWTRDLRALMDDTGACDEEQLYAKRPKDGGWEQGCVYLVYGNDGWDVLADYTVNLGPSMQPANELSDQILEAFHEHAQG